MSRSGYENIPLSDSTSNVPKSNTYIPPPLWLQEAPLGNPSKPVGAAIADQSNANTSQTVNENADASIPRIILYTRIANLVLSVCMILTSLLAVLTTQSATTGVLACYVVVFSCLLCCFETHLKQVSKIIAMNFGFMYSAKARSLFMMFIGTILFSFSLFGKIIGLLMLANAGFNLFAVFRYPQYEDMQRKDAQSEIQEYLASNPAFAKQFVDAGIKAGTEVLRQNPDLARQSSQVVYTAVTSNILQSSQTQQPHHSSSSTSLDNYASV